MPTKATNARRTGEHPGVGHACAVASAVATLLLLVIAIGLIQADPARTYPARSGFHLWGFISALVVAFMFVFGYVFAVGGLLVLLVDRVARRFGIAHLWYYLICGAATGVLVGVLPLIPAALMKTQDAHAPSASLLYHACFGIPSGLVGGWVYWYVTGRFVDRQPSAL